MGAWASGLVRRVSRSFNANDSATSSRSSDLVDLMWTPSAQRWPEAAAK